MKQIFKDLSFGVNVIAGSTATLVRLSADSATGLVSLARTAAGSADSEFATAIVSTGDGKLGSALKGGAIYEVSKSNIVGAWDDTFGSAPVVAKPRKPRSKPVAK